MGTIRRLDLAHPLVVTVHPRKCHHVFVSFPPLSHGMFTRGPIELVEYFIDKCNHKVRSDPRASGSQ